MRILVTGGAGFIGSQVVHQLIETGHEVRILDSLHPAAHSAGAREAHEAAGVPLHIGDVRDRSTVDAALLDVDAVIHQAAMVGMGVDLNDLPEYVGCNDLGTAVLLAGMARHGIRRLVLASSMVVYGEGAFTCAVDGPVRPAARELTDLATGQFEPRCPRCAEPVTPSVVDEDDRLEPRSVYAATKLAQEHLASAWARGCDGAAVALRYHNVYGPGMPRDTPYSGVAAIFRSALERGETPRVFEDGRQLRDFIHVSDVASANLSALAAVTDAGWTGLRAYNIASGHPHTVGQMATQLAQTMNGPAPVVTGDFRAGDVRHIVASPARARRELDFTAQVSFADGLADFATAPLRG